jgi:hypothetical protein
MRIKRNFQTSLSREGLKGTFTLSAGMAQGKEKGKRWQIHSKRRARVFAWWRREEEALSWDGLLRSARTRSSMKTSLKQDFCECLCGGYQVTVGLGLN